MELPLANPPYIENPFKPGAGHMPPHLAGRTVEQEGFRVLLRQTVITDNLIITGLRGVGKSVLLESMKPFARAAGWLWVGDDFTEAKSLSEERIADSIVNDLSLALAPIFVETQLTMPMGFGSAPSKTQKPLDYHGLKNVYDSTPGLPTDKLKAVLRFVGSLLQKTDFKGIVFAYDEAQNMGDRAQDNEFPLSLLLDVFQSVQRHPGGLPFMLVLTGLPTLFPKLNATRTYTERMFDVMTLDKLDEDASRDAIRKPVEDAACPITFSPETVEQIVEMSGGYPFFIQFICKEVFDAWLSRAAAGLQMSVPEEEIMRKLDQRFFSGRWDNASDRQRDFMLVAASLPHSNGEFKVQDIVDLSTQVGEKPFRLSSANMMLKTLIDNDFVFRNRRGKYSFAVPLLDQFILRQPH
ncbi:MAG TPA: hypothetical protein VFP12_06385 [Allosphingosinicella sp.]|nr:hypothetical protein [Allosphingosinicella sp.]